MIMEFAALENLESSLSRYIDFLFECRENLVNITLCEAASVMLDPAKQLRSLLSLVLSYPQKAVSRAKWIAYV